MSSSIEELEMRLAELKKLVDHINSDHRWRSSSLESKVGVNKDDALVLEAEHLKVPFLHPLTIGTLLASVLGEIESVEWALKSLLRKHNHLHV